VIIVPAIPNALMRAFEEGMRERGYVPGVSVDIIYRSAEGKPDRFSALAAEVVKLQPKVIVSGGGAPSARAAMKATSTIPIVFPAAGDPVGEGLVQSLTRPGGNVTGLPVLTTELAGKRLQLLRELLPKLRQVVVLQDVKMRAQFDQIGATRKAAAELGIGIEIISTNSADDYAGAFTAAKKLRAEAIIVLPSSSYNANRRTLIALASQHRIAVLWEHRLFTESGGLFSYGPDFAEMYRSAARYVDRILKGGHPGEMPVEQASKLELVLNARTATALGITVAPALLARADQVIR
jgi:putative tryptophan/tyrosine transport system substrate-binding protein